MVLSSAGHASPSVLVLHGANDTNVPVVEAFAAVSPFHLVLEDGAYAIRDDRSHGDRYPVEVPEEPVWYSRTTTSGVPMSRVGVLQGNYLGVYVSNSCLFWASKPSRCRPR